MRTLATLIAAAAIAAFGFTGTAFADPFADAAVLVFPAGDDCPTAGGDCDTSGDDGDNGTDALAAPDHTQHGGGDGTISAFTSLGFNTNTNLGGVLTLDFLDNACLNLAGNDLQVFEVSHGETYDIDVGIINGTLANVAAAATGDALVNAGVAFNRVEITALSGETVPFAGADIDAIQCLSPLDVADIDKVFADHADDPDDINEVDRTTVVNDGIQFKAFDITITNNTGVAGGLAGLTFIDVAPAEWDLDPLEEDDVNGCSGNAEVCDGVDVTGAAGGGLVTDCTATGAEHTNKGNGPAKLQPEIITITASSLDDGESCTITVWVTTDDDHPGKGRTKNNNAANNRGNPDFTPTSCPVTLNDGVKVFDASMNLLLQDDSSLIFDAGAAQADGTGNDGFCRTP
jgi:hypothetical protein